MKCSDSLSKLQSPRLRVGRSLACHGPSLARGIGGRKRSAPGWWSTHRTATAGPRHSMRTLGGGGHLRSLGASQRPIEVSRSRSHSMTLLCSAAVWLTAWLVRRRDLSFRFSGGFAGPGESITGWLIRSYALPASHGCRINPMVPQPLLARRQQDRQTSANRAWSVFRLSLARSNQQR
jgi:hypothetical protein